jgi:hypothetical protein
MLRDPAIAIDYRRHLMLLAAAAAVLVLCDRWHPLQAAIPACALYGALHSCMLVAALRIPQSAWKKALFVMIASGFAMLAVVAARFMTDRFTILGLGSPRGLLTLASALGAASYGLLIRQFWIRDLQARALAGITLCCLTSTLLALPSGAYLHTVGGSWFAIIWWWTFSLALWFRDRRLYRTGVPHAWHS